MAAKKVGVLVKEARTAAKLTQEKLAQAAGEGLTASDIGKCERGTADLTANQLKKIAVACGVTQTSLVNAPKNLASSAKKTAAKTTETKAAAAKKTAAKTTETKTATAKKTAAKTTAAKTAETKKTAAKKTAAKSETAAKKTGAKTTAAKNGAAKKTSSAAKKTDTPANANTSMKVTATEKKLVEAYREASGDMKKVAMKVLKGEYGDKVTGLLNVVGGGSLSGTASDGISDAIGGLLNNLLGGK